MVCLGFENWTLVSNSDFLIHWFMSERRGAFLCKDTWALLPFLRCHAEKNPSSKRWRGWFSAPTSAENRAEFRVVPVKGRTGYEKALVHLRVWPAGDSSRLVLEGLKRLFGKCRKWGTEIEVEETGWRKREQRSGCKPTKSSRRTTSMVILMFLDQTEFLSNTEKRSWELLFSYRWVEPHVLLSSKNPHTYKMSCWEHPGY